MKFAGFYSFLLMLGNAAFSQTEEAVHWLNFEQLEDSLQTNPKKVFIDFYADWCGPCLKMQKHVFTDKQIVKILNEDYYAVKMNVESTDTINFGDELFTNERTNRRNPIHQIPLLMARQKNKAFSLPAIILLDENFQAEARYFQYLNVNQLFRLLTDLKEKDL